MRTTGYRGDKGEKDKHPMRDKVNSPMKGEKEKNPAPAANAREVEKGGPDNATRTSAAGAPDARRRLLYTTKSLPSESGNMGPPLRTAISYHVAPPATSSRTTHKGLPPQSPQMERQITTYQRKYPGLMAATARSSAQTSATTSSATPRRTEPPAAAEANPQLPPVTESQVLFDEVDGEQGESVVTVSGDTLQTLEDTAYNVPRSASVYRRSYDNDDKIALVRKRNYL